MAAAWTEVTRAREGKRHELVLSGADVSKRIDEGGLDNAIFNLINLTLLEIRKTSLRDVSPNIGKLANLSSLLLTENQLTSLPDEIGTLSKLKHIDVSNNKLTTLPSSMSQLIQLRTLNAAWNKLTTIPDLSKASELMLVDVCHNELTNFPVDFSAMVTDKTAFSHLKEIKARGNKITSVPGSLAKLPLLKLLDLGNNLLTTIPGEVGECEQLLDINLGGNSFKDKKLSKIIEKGVSKAILRLIRESCPRENWESSDGKDGKKSKKGARNRKTTESEDTKIEDLLRVLRVSENSLVTITDSVKDVRPFIVCCIVKDVYLNGDKFKKFIAVQTKIHENECEKRAAATIATHDLGKINGKITYEAMPANEIKIIPLGKEKEVTAAEYYSMLHKEAEAHRKLKKRNTYSGVHKFLYLLEKWPVFPYLTDGSNEIISLPPLTNGNGTKITPETKDVFIEVTSSTSLPVCKTVMEVLLKEMLQLGLGTADSEGAGGESESKRTLVVEQVRICNKEGQLKVVYPSQADLALDGVEIVRE